MVPVDSSVAKSCLSVCPKVCSVSQHQWTPLRAAHDRHVALGVCGLTVKGDRDTNVDYARNAEDDDDHGSRVHEDRVRIKPGYVNMERFVGLITD